MAVTSGAAQESVLGPDLWNVTFDGLLRIEMPEEKCLVGYADDVAVLVVARSVDMTQLKLSSYAACQQLDGGARTRWF